MYGSIKKHYNQMSYSERKFLKGIIRNKRKHRFSKHVLERMQEKGITEYEVYFVFKSYTIIEYHKKGTDNRVLLRSTKPINGRCICISMSLDTGDIITVYANHYEDEHKTLVEEKYNPYIQVIPLIKQRKII